MHTTKTICKMYIVLFIKCELYFGSNFNNNPTLYLSSVPIPPPRVSSRNPDTTQPYLNLLTTPPTTRATYLPFITLNGTLRPLTYLLVS